MLNIKNILFPTDFTPQAEDAFSHAARLAAHFDAQIHVFNVVTPEAAGETNPMDYLPLEQADDALVLAAEDVDLPGLIGADQDVSVVYQKMEGQAPAKAIIDYVPTHDIDLVVMGTHGRSGVARLLNGSVSEEVVRQAACPVLTVVGHDDLQSSAEVRRVLAPVDFSEHAELGLAHAAGLAQAYGAALDVLHIVEEAVFPAVYGIDPIAPHMPAVRSRAHEALETLVQKTVPENVAAELHVRIGYAAREMLDFADEEATDLIGMATHGRTGLERFLIGSVAEKVIRSARCPVFTIKPFGKSLLAPADEAAGTAAPSDE